MDDGIRGIVIQINPDDDWLFGLELDPYVADVYAYFEARLFLVEMNGVAKYNQDHILWKHIL